MSIQIETGNGYLKKAAIALLAAALGATSVAASAEQTDTGKRSSQSLHFTEGGRSNNRDPQKGSQTVDEYGELSTTGKRVKPAEKSLAKGSSAAAVESFDFWIYEADVVLFNDDDADGYFHGIDLLFDADTIYGVAEVYAAVYLSYEGGPWNEYAVTDDFTIFGTSPNDEYVLVTELMSGYPTGDYDLLIELFDAVNGSFLASFGPADTSELSFLPLEDFNRDAPAEPTEPQVTVSRGGGGALGIWMLLALIGTRQLRRFV